MTRAASTRAIALAIPFAIPLALIGIQYTTAIAMTFDMASAAGSGSADAPACLHDRAARNANQHQQRKKEIPCSTSYG